MSTKNWKPAVKVGGADDWSYNALVFATQKEAQYSADELSMRWMMVTETGATETDDPVNYRIDFETHTLHGVSA